MRDREFNELPHLFERRLLSSYSPSLKFMDISSPNQYGVILSLISFITGSLLASEMGIQII